MKGVGNDLLLREVMALSQSFQAHFRATPSPQSETSISLSALKAESELFFLGGFFFSREGKKNAFWPTKIMMYDPGDIPPFGYQPAFTGRGLFVHLPCGKGATC